MIKAPSSFLFTSLYDFSHELIIGVLEKSVFLNCLEKTFLYLSNIPESHTTSEFIMQELTIEQITTYRAQFLEKFGDLDTLYIVPKKEYHLILETNMLTPQESALQIVRYVESLNA